MDHQDKIAEKIIKQALDNGGEIIFHHTELRECKDTQLLKDVSLILSIYGEIHGMMISYRWTYYKINEKGYKFIKEGGFKGEEERKNRKDEIELLTLENARLQKEAAEYQKQVRIWQIISAILTLAITLLAAIKS